MVTEVRTKVVVYNNTIRTLQREWFLISMKKSIKVVDN